MMSGANFFGVQHLHLVVFSNFIITLLCNVLQSTNLGPIQAYILVLYHNYLLHYQLIALYKIVFNQYALLIE